MRQEKQIYLNRVDSNLHDLDRQIDDLQVRITKTSKVERKQLNQQMAELERKRAIAHEKLEKLKSSSEEAFGDMKVGFNAAMDNLQAAYEKAAADFK
jgi:chromosome segregation ATPase